MSSQKPKKIPLGRPLHLTDDQLEEMAKVTATDIEKSKQLWRNTAPPEFQDLLDAGTIEDGKQPKSK
jgi:hypothetical protein